jgi:hypothetical protein
MLEITDFIKEGSVHLKMFKEKKLWKSEQKAGKFFNT